MRGGSKLGYQGSQVDQVRHPKARASGRCDKERIFRLDARPARRQRGDIAEAVAVEEEVFTPPDPSFDAVDLLSDQGVEWVGNPDR